MTLKCLLIEPHSSIQMHKKTSSHVPNSVANQVQTTVQNQLSRHTSNQLGLGPAHIEALQSWLIADEAVIL